MTRTVGMVVGFAMFLFVSTGCFDIQQTIELNRDLSGTNTIEITIDMGAMLGPIAAMAGEDFDLQAEMEGVLEKQKADLDPKIEELKAALPPGTHLLHSEERIEGGKIVVSIGLSFDDLDALVAFHANDAMGQLGDEAGEAPSLGALSFERTGHQLVLQFDPLAPDDAGNEAPPEGADPAVTAMMTQMLGGTMNLSLVVDAPFAVQEHNGTSKEGSQVRWSYDLVELQRLQRDGQAPAPRLVLRTDRAADAAPGIATLSEVVEPAPLSGPATITALSGKNEMTFVQVPGGRVTLEGRTRTVDPLYMAQSEVTQRQWKKVLRGRPSACTSGCGPTLPVQNVTWVQAAELANALSISEGLTPCYLIDEGRVAAPTGPQCPGFRLPTEAEWQLAVRAGSADAYPWGTSENGASAFAWHAGNSEGKAHPVMTREPNPYGVYDLSGNVAEWVFDAYTDDAADRAARGGSFADEPSGLQCDARRGYPPRIGHTHVGVRLVRSLNPE